MKPSDILNLIKETFKEWSEDKAPRLAAALAYYTVFSLAPLLVIAIAIAGIVFGQQAARDQILTEIGGLIGSDSVPAVQAMVEGANRGGTSIIATIVGIALLLFGASGVFGQLQDSLNTIWEVKPKPGQGILALVKNRFFSFTVVVGTGFLLLVSLIVSAALTAVGDYFTSLLPGWEVVLQIINLVVSYLVVTFMFALIFKFMPDAEIAWKDVWFGAGVTALLFMIGRILIQLYITNSDFGSSYGVAGSLIVILIWVYYSAQIVLMGAEFTQVYANQYGSRIVPKENAEMVTEEERAQQGITRQGPRTQPTAASQAPASGWPVQAEAAGGWAAARTGHSGPGRPVREPGLLSQAEPSMLAFFTVVGTLAGFLSGLVFHARNIKGQTRPNRRRAGKG